MLTYYFGGISVDCTVLRCIGGLDDMHVSMDLIMVFQLTECLGASPGWGSLGVSVA